MSDVAALLLSALLAALIAPAALHALRDAGWIRANYRGTEVAFPAGVVAVLAAIVVLPFARAGAGPEEPALAWAPLFLGVAILGLVDDLLDAPARGWRGHFGALLRGRLSTGVVKAVGTVALAAAVVAAAGRSGGEYVLAVAVIALATNLFNLLDLRPGRAWKGYLVVAVALVAAAGTEPLAAVGPFAGALLVLGFFDLRERAMLGDTGSNVLGALAGAHAVLALSTTALAVALALLAALTIYGELGSFSRAIDRLPPLRSLDSLGRRDA